MRTSVLILFFSLLSFLNKGLVRTVSNNPNSPGQYTSVATAYAAASVGDTLYVVGSMVSYGGIAITKSITIIGSGYYPNSQNSLPTTFSGITISRIPTSDPSGTQIIGIKVLSISMAGYTGSPTLALSGIGIVRCDVGGVYPAELVSQCTVLNCIVGNFLINTSSTVTGTYNLYNNIIKQYIYTGYGGYYNINNNLFISSSGNAFSSSSSNMSVVNNIFYGGVNHTVPTGTNNIFKNNLTTNTVSFTSGGTNTSTNNIINTSPLFVSSSLNTYTNTADYHLGSGSPAIGAGFGGVDIGIYGGTLSFPSGGASLSGFQTSPSAKIPQIYEMNLLNPAVSTSGTLSIQVKVRKVD
jgi:hypothetical protein